MYAKINKQAGLTCKQKETSRPILTCKQEQTFRPELTYGQIICNYNLNKKIQK